MNKKTFLVTIEERLARQVEIEAKTEEQAYNKIIEMYRNEQVVLGANDYVGVDITEIKENKIFGFRLKK